MKKAAAGIFVFVLLILLINALYFVREDEYAIIKRFDKVIEIKKSAGLGIKVPFIDDRSTLTKKLVMYDLAPTEVITKDKKNMTADTYAVWYIEDPLLFLQTAVNINEFLRRIEAQVYGSLKTTISEVDQVEIIESRTNNTLNDMILQKAKTAIAAYGVVLVDVQIKRFDLPDSNRSAVYERMISERRQIAATYTAEGEEEANMIRYSADKEREIIVSRARARAAELEAEGESEFMRILSDAYNDPDRAEFYEYIRMLDALKITMHGDKTLILPNDSPLARGLTGDMSEAPAPASPQSPGTSAQTVPEPVASHEE